MRRGITQWVRRMVVRHGFERRYGVETERPVALEDLGLAAPGRIEYRPTPWRVFQRALPRDQVGPDDVFLDLGCGMGRVCVLAARYPFRRVIGVELSPELAAIARRNVERARGRAAARDVEIVTADATAYEIPPDVTFVYLYNPFTGEIFRRVVENLLASHDRAPRRVRVVYHHPTEHAALAETGRFRLLDTVGSGSGEGATTHVYELVAPSR